MDDLQKQLDEVSKAGGDCAPIIQAMKDAHWKPTLRQGATYRLDSPVHIPMRI